MHGVNLGGWLVLEKWLTPSLFAGTSAVDEHGLWALNDAALRRRLEAHRRNFVTKQDFAWLASQGVDAVRIPVGYWLFGDELAAVPSAPYRPAAAYLDKAFAWAEATGIRVLLSVHGAPGSQNGQMHSGRQGPVAWHTRPEHIQQTLMFVQKLAEHYGRSPALWGVGLLNEPAKTVPHAVLKSYYRQAYQLVRQACGPDVAVIINDIYHPGRWNWSFHRPTYKNVYIDTHQYQIFKGWQQRMDVGSHLIWTATWVRAQLAWFRLHHQLVIGEWSAALDRQSLAGVAPADIVSAYKAYYRIQRRIYRKQAGYFYWTYKSESLAGDPWSFRSLQE